MRTAETPEQKFQRMTEAPVAKLVCTLAVPTIFSMLISSIYNMADTFFVGRLGTSASGAVGIAMSLMAIIQAIGFTIGSGSGNYISRLLGQQERERAESVLSTGFFSALGVGLVFSVIGLLFLEPLVRLLGSTDTILPYARAYAGYILLGAPYMAASLVLNNVLRYQGSAFYSMLGITAGGVLNIALDPLFIFVLDMGTGGAALATIISQFVSFCILLYTCRCGSNLRIRIRAFNPRWSMYREILRGGLPSFYRQGLMSVATICLNTSAGVYGDAAIAAMSIVTRVFQFANSAMLGFGQGFQPVCGFNYGARRYDRVLQAFRFCIKVSLGVLIAFSVVGFLFAPNIVELFRKGDPDVVRIGSLAMRIQCFTFPLGAWIIMVNMLLQTIGQSGRASVLALARQGLFFLPSILLLPPLLGVLGVQISQPIADLASFLLAIPLGLSTMREMRQSMPALETPTNAVAVDGGSAS